MQNGSLTHIVATIWYILMIITVIIYVAIPVSCVGNPFMDMQRSDSKSHVNIIAVGQPCIIVILFSTSVYHLSPPVPFRVSPHPFSLVVFLKKFFNTHTHTYNETRVQQTCPVPIVLAARSDSVQVQIQTSNYQNGSTGNEIMLTSRMLAIFVISIRQSLLRAATLCLD